MPNRRLIKPLVKRRVDTKDEQIMDGQLSPVSQSNQLSDDLAENLMVLKRELGNSSDIVFRDFRTFDGRNAVVIYVDGLSDTSKIDTDVLLRLTTFKPVKDETSFCQGFMKRIREEYVTASDVIVVHTFDEVLDSLMVDTQTVLLVDGESIGLGIGLQGGKTRSVEEPATEAVIRGPREGFNEHIGTSIALLRRRLRTPDFIVETHRVGRYTKTTVAICYINGIVDPGLIDEVRTRITRIQTDGVIDSGYIEEFIEDVSFSPFPQFQNTERPDVVTALLLEGRVAILTDGSPFALLAPINFWSALQAAEDYYERFMIATLIRWLRYFFMFIALYLPSLYVAVSTFHQEMLPTKALLSVAAAREVTPFPAVLEALIMEVTFEALREAGVRLPKTIGSTVSIVGALVIGQAAVEAGIISAPMVIIVSITGIASFVIPRYNFAIGLRMLRFPMILLAGTLGLFGIVIGSMVIVIHLSGLRSLGVPYLQPVSPFNAKNMQDVFMRAPRWSMLVRPEQTSKRNLQRQTKATQPENRIPGKQKTKIDRKRT